jgi:tRNA G37 N-methylase Trm5
MHDTKHPWAGKTVMLTSGQFAGQQYRIEDWWDHLTGKSWGDSEGNPAAIDFAFRHAVDSMAIFKLSPKTDADRQRLLDAANDDEVVYGHIGAYGKLIHISQLPAELPVEA